MFHSLLGPAEHCGWGTLVASRAFSGAERALLAPVPGTAVSHWPWPWCWSTARGAAARWQGGREPQTALICTPGWDWAGTGGSSLFPDNFLLSCHPPDQQDMQLRLRFLLDSLLEWKKLVSGVLTFQNVLFHFKGLRRN